jgi:hypothetical protein
LSKKPTQQTGDNVRRVVVGLFSLMALAGGRTILVLAYEAFRVDQVRGTSAPGGAIFLALAGLTLLAGGIFGLWRAITGYRER